MNLTTPFVCESLRVLPEWIDLNGHMNVAAYLKAFDEGFGVAFDWLGLSAAQVAERGVSSMTAEVNVSYRRELLLDAPLRITTQLLACDRKRSHWQQAMYHRDEGYLAATAEWLVLHVDLNERRVCALPDDLFARLQIIEQAHRDLPPITEIGRAISMNNRRPV